MRTVGTIFSISFLILAFSLGTYQYIDSSSQGLVRQLEAVESLIDSQNWEQASEDLAKTEKSWEKTKTWWTILLDHQEIDNIDVSLQRTIKYVQSQSTALSLGELSALILLVDHIAETESFTLTNIL